MFGNPNPDFTVDALSIAHRTVYAAGEFFTSIKAVPQHALAAFAVPRLATTALALATGRSTIAHVRTSISAPTTVHHRGAAWTPATSARRDSLPPPGAGPVRTEQSPRIA
jgi:hypothetical protein